MKVDHLPACSWLNGERIYKALDQLNLCAETFLCTQIEDRGPSPSDGITDWLTQAMCTFGWTLCQHNPMKKKLTSLVTTDILHLLSFYDWRSWYDFKINKLSIFKEEASWAKKVLSGNVLTLLQHRMWAESGPSGFYWQWNWLRADVGSHGCSCQVNFCCDAACMHPDRDPGSPGRGPDALGYAVS